MKPVAQMENNQSIFPDKFPEPGNSTLELYVLPDKFSESGSVTNLWIKMVDVWF